MKSIIYILIAVFIGSILLSAIPKTSFSKKQSLSIQCVDREYTAEDILLSKNIIKSRLNDYSINDKNFKISKNNDCITLKFSPSNAIEFPSSLLTSSGKVEFYETYDRFAILNKVELDSTLLSILTIPTANEKSRFSAIIGQCSADNIFEAKQLIADLQTNSAALKANFFWGEKPNQKGMYFLYALHSYSALNNSLIAETKVIHIAQNESLQLSIKFNDQGKTIFRDLTKTCIGKSVAIVLDNEVLAAPVVQSEIMGGKCIISGDFSNAETLRLNSLIGNETLPLNFRLKN